MIVTASGDGPPPQDVLPGDLRVAQPRAPLGPAVRRAQQRVTLHRVRDVTFCEDVHQARTRNGPAVAAVLRNTTIGWHHINRETTIARATRRANRRPADLVAAVTSNNPATQ